jgi:hypothetical protein
VRAALLRGALALALLAPAAARADGADKERTEVPEPAPLVVGRVRYQAPAFTQAQGLAHNGGYVEAVDAATGARRWIVDVLGPPARDGKETDKTDVFIATLALAPGGRALLVTDERGRRFRLDLRTRRVTPLPAP